MTEKKTKRRGRRESDRTSSPPKQRPGRLARSREPAVQPIDRDGRASLLSDYDLHLFSDGSHFRLYDHLGAHPLELDGAEGTMFGVWAPNAAKVAVIGDFNDWDVDATPLSAVGASGIWEGFVPGVRAGDRYKYHIRSRLRDHVVDKADPFATRCEIPPQTASIVGDLDFEWRDDEWMQARPETNRLDAPMSIYEVHVGSWRAMHELGAQANGYREIGEALAEHVQRMGFTHVEFLPLTEHPFHGSWGYQTTAYFAPTGRYGTPRDLMAMIEALHRAGIGVILDWVPSHFPSDEHGLVYFDGTHLFEHEDPRRGFHPDWNSYIFNYGRNEVRSFLISSALFWLSEYHMDGLRVDAVASMLYRDYSRREGEWVPGPTGGRENEEAIAFLQRLNEAVHEEHPDARMIAEESTAWPGVTAAVSEGGLGFDLKWDMGWMHDTLSYFRRDPIHRKHHHDELTFRVMYANSENFVLSLSHDEVVHGKGSLLTKMAGDGKQKFANLRVLLAYMFAQPGKKLLFMGDEIAQPWEWNHDDFIGWHLLEDESHAGIARLVTDLNGLYRDCPALYELDKDPSGFEWIEPNDSEQSCFSFLRKSKSGDDRVAVVINATPIERRNFRIGVPGKSAWREVLNTDSREYGGGGHGNLGEVEAAPVRSHGRRYSLNLTLPPLAAVFLENPA